MAPSSVLAQSLGTVSAGGGSGSPGNSFTIPVSLSLSGNTSIDALAFGLQVTPNGNAPGLSGSLSFSNSLPSVPFTTPTGSQSISVLWSSISPALTGTIALGSVSMTIPSSAQNGQTYTVTISGVSGARSGTGVVLAAGGDATLTVVAPDFSLSLSPSSQSVAAGSAASYAATITTINGFSSPVSFACSGLPSGASCGFVPNPASPGTSALTVSTHSNTPAGTVTFTVIGGSGLLTRTATVQLTVTVDPVFTSASVTNGASFAVGAVAGSIITIFGTGLTRGVLGVVSATDLPLPTELRGTSVTVNGVPAPLFAIANVNGQEQINLQIPYEVTGQSTITLAVNNNGIISNSVQVALLAVQPGIFTVDGSTGAILHGSNFQPVTSANPAAKGEAVLIYATGLGPVSPAPRTGASASASPPSLTTLVPSVSVGGIPGQVLFSGLAPGLVGLYQVNVVIPQAAPSGSVDVVLQVSDQVSKPVKLATQ